VGVGLIKALKLAADEGARLLVNAAAGADALARARTEAEELSKINAAGTFAPSPGVAFPPGSGPGAGGGGLVGPTGLPVTAGRGATRGGGSGGGAAGAGGGGGNTQRVSAAVLRNLDGMVMPREWVEAYCTPTTLRVPTGPSGLGVTPGSAGGRDVDAWICPAPWGTFIDDDAALATVSKTTTRGAQLRRGTPRRHMIGGRGISGQTFNEWTPGEGLTASPGVSGDRPQDQPQSGSGGLQSSGQGLTVDAPGVNERLDGVTQRLDRVAGILEQGFQGDGGAGVRAGGGL
jgi:hypothetical protein